MKAVLLQLPVQSHDYGYSLENIPFASGYLASYAQKRLPEGVDIEVCPADIGSFGGDAAVLDWIASRGPDIIGFSCYLWNIERSLHIAQQIGEGLGRARIVLGGPEISPDNVLLRDARFHAAVLGEGEESFGDLLCAWAGGRADLTSIPGLLLKTGHTLEATEKRRAIASLDAIPSPYLAGALGTSYTKTMFLETVRGCLYQCSYCSYHKQFRKLRAFDLDRIAAEIQWALRSGVEEISFIDPCFARRPKLRDLLTILARAQSVRRLKISCELNAEDLDPEMVAELVRAGLSHVEIGLQSTNPKALKLSNRRFDETRFIRGITMLRAAGVHVVTDIMVGLPGDTLGDVKNSIDFVLENSLFDDLNLYPVSVLPNTELRSKASLWGVSYQDRPPYYVVDTPDMSSVDIRDSFSYAESRTGDSYFPVELPYRGSGLSGQRGRYAAHLVMSPHGGGLIPPACIGQALAVEFADPLWLDKKDGIRKSLAPLLEANPYTLVSFIIEDEHFRHDEALPFLRTLAHRAPHLCDREFMSTVEGLCSRRLFIKSSLGNSCEAWTLVPLQGEIYELQAFLPEEAGEVEEDLLLARLAQLFGREVAVRFHDMPIAGNQELCSFLGSGAMKI